MRNYTLLLTMLLAGQLLYGQCGFTYSLSVPAQLCPRQSGNFSMAVTGGAGPFAYIWDFGDGTIIGGGPSESYQYALPANYPVSVTVMDDLGCMETATATVVVAPPPAFQISNNGPLCTGENLLLTSIAQGTPTYAWGGPNGFNSTDASPTVFGVGLADAGLYRVTASWADGCTASLSTTVNISGQLFVQINGQATVCPGSGLQASAVANSCGLQPYTFAWTGPNGFSSNTYDLQIPLVSPADTGTYSVTVTDNTGATASAGIAVALSALEIQIQAAERTCDGSCEGRAFVEALGGAAPYAYQWENGDLGPQADALCAGSYRVTATDANGCSTGTDVTISSNPAPEPETTATDANCAGQQGTATISGPEVFAVMWSTGDTDFTLTNLSPGLYTVTAVSDQGCTATDTVQVNAAFYCGFTITGRVVLDGNGDCATGVGDFLLGGRLVTVLAGGPFLSTNLGGVFTRPDGSFTFSTLAAGPYGVKAWPSGHRVLANLCDSVAVAAMAPGDTISLGDLYLRSDGLVDLAVTLSEGLSVSGQTRTAHACVWNVGAQPAQGTVAVQMTQNILSVSVPHTLPTPTSAQWSVPLLAPGESYCATLALESPIATVGAQTDEAILTVADAVPPNNVARWYFSDQAALSAPYKQVCGSANWSYSDAANGSVTDCAPLDGFYLNYRIGFQNQTADTIRTVEVRDTLDLARLDLRSLALQSTGHPVDCRLEGQNVLVCRFEQADLPPAAQDFAASMGHVALTVRPTGLFFSQFGQVIGNDATVAFLPAPAVATNLSTATYDDCVGLWEPIETDGRLFPNPSDGLFWIEGTFAESGRLLLEVFDALGRSVHSAYLSVGKGKNSFPVDLGQVPVGAYWVRLSGEGTLLQQKLMIGR